MNNIQITKSIFYFINRNFTSNYYYYCYFTYSHSIIIIFFCV